MLEYKIGNNYIPIRKTEFGNTEQSKVSDNDFSFF